MKKLLKILFFVCCVSAFSFAFTTAGSQNMRVGNEFGVHTEEGTITQASTIFYEFFIQPTLQLSLKVKAFQQVYFLFSLIYLFLFGLSLAQRKLITQEQPVHVYQRLSRILYPFHDFW